MLTGATSCGAAVIAMPSTVRHRSVRGRCGRDPGSRGHDGPDVAAADLAWGAFPDDAPWVLDRGAIPWSEDAEQLREDARGQVPTLIRPGRLPPGGRGITVVARLGIAVVPWVWRRHRGKAP